MNIVWVALPGNQKERPRFPGASALLAPQAEDERALWVPYLGGAFPDIQNAGAMLDWLAARWFEEKPDLLIFQADSMGHELAIRLSARLGRPCFPEVRSLCRAGGELMGRKKVCGSNLDWEFTVELPAILTVAPGKPASLPETAAPATERRLESLPLDLPGPSREMPPWLLSREPLEPYRVNPLESAPLIFVAGRGLGSAAACEWLRRIAARFGAPLGFSRPAALNGWGNIGDIIGQSGIKTRAKVCVALGVSGAAAFMAGIEGVEHLAAINADKNAPIFQYADLGIIAPAEEFMASLEALIN